MTDDKFTNSGSEYMQTSENNICHICKNLISVELRKCFAFDKIPGDIWDQDFVHTEIYPGQENEIMFKEK